MRYSVLIIISIIFLSNGTTAEHDALDILLKNKKLIETKLKLDEHIAKSKKQEYSNMEDLMRDSIVSLFERIQKQYSDKESINYIKSVYERFFYLIVSKLSSTPKISDSIDIMVLANLLRSNNGNSDWARDKLVNKTMFAALKVNSTYIKQQIRNSILNGYKKYSLLRLLEVDSKERDSILACRGLELYEKASVNDTLLDSLLMLYKKEIDPKLKCVYGGKLMKTGNKRAAKAALEDFCAPIYEITKYKSGIPCTTNTLQGTIVEHLSRFNADAPEYDSSGNVNDYANSPVLLEKRIAFWKIFSKWVLSNYAVKLQDSMPPAFLKCCQRSSVYR